MSMEVEAWKMEGSQDDQDSRKKSKKLADMEDGDQEKDEEMENATKEKGTDVRKKSHHSADMEDGDQEKKEAREENSKGKETDGKKKTQQRLRPFCDKKFSRGKAHGAQDQKMKDSKKPIQRNYNKKNALDEDGRLNRKASHVKPVADLAQNLVGRVWLRKGKRGGNVDPESPICHARLLMDTHYKFRSIAEKAMSSTTPRASQAVVNQLKNRDETTDDEALAPVAAMDNDNKAGIQKWLCDQCSSSKGLGVKTPKAHDSSPTSDAVASTPPSPQSIDSDSMYWCNCGKTTDQALRARKASIYKTIDQEASSATKLICDQGSPSKRSKKLKLQSKTPKVAAVDHGVLPPVAAMGNNSNNGGIQKFYRCLSGGVAKEVKTCVDCGTSKTPVWRGGPAGPKSLCNACGLTKHKKKRSALLGLKKEDNKAKKASKTVDFKGKNSNYKTIDQEASCAAMDNNSKRGVPKLICDQGSSAKGRKKFKQVSKTPKVAVAAVDHEVLPPVAAVGNNSNNGGIQKLYCDQGSSSKGRKDCEQWSKTPKGDKVLDFDHNQVPEEESRGNNRNNGGIQKSNCDQGSCSKGRKDCEQGLNTPEGEKVLDFEHRCSYCGEKFATGQALGDHKSSHTKFKISISGGIQKFNCDQGSSSKGKKDYEQGSKKPEGEKVLDFDLNQVPEES